MRCSRSTAPLRVFYDLDTPITLNRLAEGDLDYLRASQLPAFDLVFSWTGGGALVALERDFGVRMARPLFGCVDPDVYRPVRPYAELRCELSYMGTYAADRQAKLESMFLEAARQRPSSRFLLAGSLYPPEWQWPANVRRFEHVGPSDHPVLYCSSRLTLNLTRAEMAASGYCPSGRFFEAAACGAPIITDWFRGLDSFFEPGEEVLVASDTGDVLHAARPFQTRSCGGWPAAPVSAPSTSTPDASAHSPCWLLLTPPARPPLAKSRWRLHDRNHSRCWSRTAHSAARMQQRTFARWLPRR